MKYTFIISLLIAFSAKSQWDMSFGTQGCLMADFSQYEDLVDIAQSNSGDVYATVYNLEFFGNDINYDFSILKFSSDGILDSVFCHNHLNLDFESYSNSWISSMTFDDQDNLYLLGYANDTSNYSHKSMQIQKWLPNGSLDSTFGVNGSKEYFLLGVEEEPDVIKYREGLLYVAGASFDSAYNHKETPYLMRMDINGNPDTSFGGSGGVIFDFLNLETEDLFNRPVLVEKHMDGGFVTDIELDTEGNIYVIGAYDKATQLEGFIAKVNQDGTLDNGFAGTGILLMDVQPGYTNFFTDLEIGQGNELFMTVGVNSPLIDDDFFLFQLNPDNLAMEFVNFDFNQNKDIGYDCIVGGDQVITIGETTSDVTSNFYESFAILFSDHTGNEDSLLITEPVEGIYSGARRIITLQDHSVLVAGYSYKNMQTDSTDIAIMKLNSLLVPVGKEERGNLEIKIFPNPVSDVLYIDSDQIIDEVEMYDLSGNLILTQKHTEFSCRVFPPGMYVLKVKSGSLIKVCPIVIQR